MPHNTKHRDNTFSAAVAGTAVAGTPFLGLVGRGTSVHPNDPFFNKKIPRKDLAAFLREAQPGDVILTSKNKGSGWKTMQYPNAAEWYHAQPILGRRRGKPTTITAGDLADPAFKQFSKSDVLRSIHSLEDVIKAERYSDLVLLRPKKPLTDAQLRTFVNDVIARSKQEYSAPRAMLSWFKRMFVPNISFDTAKKVNPTVWECAGDVCSTMPAHAYGAATNNRIVPGLDAHNTLPADFLRADSAFRPVAARISREGFSPAHLKSRGLLVRGSTGALLGLTAAAAAKDPSTIPVVPTALLTLQALPKISGQIAKLRALQMSKNMDTRARNRIIERAIRSGEHAFPSFLDLMNTSKTMRQAKYPVWKRFLGRSLPLSVLAGGGAYLLTDKLRKA